MSGGVFEKLKILMNVYRRIHYFRKMYPLSSIIKDAVLFPIDYSRDGKRIETIRNVTMVITHRCNIRCEMCYFHEELKNPQVLPLETYKRIVDQVKSRRPCIQLTGGEPFTHPDIIDMVAYARQNGLAVQVFSNGSLVTKDKADALVAAGLDYMNFTLLGNERTHSLVAGVPRTYEKLIANIEYFAGHRGNTDVILNYTITPRALKDIGHAFDIVRKYELDGLRIQHYMFLKPEEFASQARVMSDRFQEEGVTHETECRVDVSAMAEEIIALRRSVAEKYPKVNVQWAPTLTDDEIRNWYSLEPFRTGRKCFFPWRGIQVDADGRIYPCSKIYLDLGDSRTGDVLDIWNGELMHKFRRQLKKSLYPACSRCCKL